MSKYRNVMIGVCAIFAAMLIVVLCARTKQGRNRSRMERIRRLGTICAWMMRTSTTRHMEAGGTPLVLLHGGLYGYIEEFGELIGELSKHRRVIAIATRGHGKSELGTKPFSYALFASDAVAVIHHETEGKVDVLGFSDGAVTSYALASAHPELLRRLVAIGGPRKFTDWTLAAQAEFKNAKALRCGTGLPTVCVLNGKN